MSCVVLCGLFASNTNWGIMLCCRIDRGDCWCSDDQEVEISEGSIVRLRIMGVTVDAGAIVSYTNVCIVLYVINLMMLQSAIGTIKDNYLGVCG